MSFALALLAVTMARPVSWTGTPVWQSGSPDAAHVRTVFHKVGINLTATTATYTAKTLYKNTGDKPLSAQVLVPVIGKDGTEDWLDTSVTGKWGDANVASIGKVEFDNGVKNVVWYGFKVTMKPGEWKAFESRLSRPLNKAGEGLAERFVTYLVQPGTDQWEQFQIAINYPKGLVFQTVTVSPNMGWQIGDTGAFYSKKDWTPGMTSFRMQFYPGTFEKIGR